MPGGLLNIVSEGQGNIMFNSNPSKTFFKSTYKKYTNFGLQKFRVDYEGSRTLQVAEQSEFIFRIPRYAELLMDCYLSVTLPNIWSPILPPINDTTNQFWAPYEFRWIENIGAKMIDKITFTVGGQILNEYSGNYLLAMMQRDFSDTKKELFNRMIGQVPELVSPANANARLNVYPNAFYNGGNPAIIEPSIRGRTLYIPLNSWFCLNTQQAFPLVSLQYNELQIKITFRPVNQLFQIRDVYDQQNQYPYVAPNFNQDYMQLYRFLQPPPTVDLDPAAYANKSNLWDPAIHLNCTYGFLSDDESRVFAKKEQTYLIKKIFENRYYNLSNATKIQLNSLGMVSNHLFYFQRSDANLRNEWSNYTNWPYNHLPNNVIFAPTDGSYIIPYRYGANPPVDITVKGPGVNLNNQLTGWMVTPNNVNNQNARNILLTLAILFDGAYRENTQPEGVYNLIEKYTRTQGNAPDGLYCYNFALHSSPFDLQPSGAVNMSRFTEIEYEIVTINPPLDPLAQSISVCDPETHQVIGVNKPTWRIYQYTYDMYFFEERLNFINFVGGNCGLQYAL